MRGRGAAAPCGRDRTRRGAIRGIAVGAVTIDAALLGLIAPLLPQIGERAGASDAALGIALAAYAAPIALLSLPLGRAADRFGRRALLIAGLLLIAAGSVLIAVSHSLEPLIAARAIQGVGSAASWISAWPWSPTRLHPDGAVSRWGRHLRRRGLARPPALRWAASLQTSSHTRPHSCSPAGAHWQWPLRR